MTNPSVGYDEIQFHQGETLFMTSQTYESLPKSLVEGAQNSVDAGATRVFIGIDLMERRVAILDNGNGATRQKFQVALGSVNKGIKSADAMGRFGRGLVAGVHLCDTMSFISRAKGSREIYRWDFVGKALKQRRGTLNIPRDKLDMFPELPEPFTHAHNEAKPSRKSPRAVWNTMLLYDRVTTDRAKTELTVESLETSIRLKLNHGIKKNGTFIFVKLRDEHGKISTCRIDPTSYTGKPLEAVTYQAPQAGTVTFTLYQARMTGGKRAGHVVVRQTGDTSQVPIKEFRRQAMGGRWYSADFPEIKEGFDALCSGFFEGELTGDNLTLHPDRDKFEMDDPATDMYVYIGEWWTRVGKALYNDEQTRRKEERYKELGEKSLMRLLHKLQSPAMARLVHDLQGVLSAGGESHEQGVVRSGKIEKPTRTPGGSGGKAGGGRTRDPKVVAKPRPPRIEGAGTEQTSPGIFSFAYEILQGVHLWEFDHENNIMTFNVLHGLWVKVDQADGKRTARTDRQVMALQEWLAFKVMLLLAEGVDPARIEDHRGPIDNEVKYYIEVFILG